MKDGSLFFSKRVYSLAFLMVFVSIALIGCGADRQVTFVEGGDPVRGAQSIQRHGCHSCHRIPGIPGANSYVGPPLNGWSDRQYIAGNLQNTPDNLIIWIMEPQSIEPGTAMPNMDINEQEARDIAAYLYTLEPERTSVWNRGE